MGKIFFMFKTSENILFLEIEIDVLIFGHIKCYNIYSKWVNVI